MSVKLKKSPSNRQYKLFNQVLNLKDVNLKRQFILGYTELSVQPQTSTGKIWKVNLNCKQCRILKVKVNGHSANFSYADATLKITAADSKKRNLEFYEASLYEAVMSCDSDCVSGGGELIVKVPRDAYPKDTSETTQVVLKIGIEFSLEKPKGGVQFVECKEGQATKYSHMFTYNWRNSSRLWFPCVDSYSELCTWEINVTVPSHLVVVASGELSDQLLSIDGNQKTYCFSLPIPTAAPNVAMAIGPFEIFPDPILPEMVHFCLPGLLSALKNTISFISGIFGFYEEYLSSRFPFTTCKFVFVDESYDDISTYSTLCICHTHLLHSPRVIDPVPRVRLLLAEALAKQYFGCYISSASLYDWWLPLGIAKFVSLAALRKMFGATEGYYHIMQAEEKVASFEIANNVPALFSTQYITSPTSNTPGVVPMATASPLDYPPSGRFTNHPYFLSDKAAEVMTLRAFLVVQMIESRIGKDQLHQVFNKLLSLASVAAESSDPSSWNNLLVSLSGLMKLVHTVSGKDITNLLEQWVCRNGVPRINVAYTYIRKKNILEVRLRQEVPRGGSKFVGPLTVAVQELDGFYSHTIQVEELSSTYELPCHSKIRKSKKRKVPLSCGEEVEMDLSQTDTEIPVLWINVDPEGQWLKKAELEQSDNTWQYVLRYERSATMQIKAAEALGNFPNPLTKTALLETILNKNFYFRVRLKACDTLVQVLNSMAGSGVSAGPIISLYQRVYGSKCAPNILKYLDFSDVAAYELQKFLPICAARCRALHGSCPKEVLQFLIDTIKYSDNKLNKYTDSFHTASLMDAMSAYVTPSVSVLASIGRDTSVKTLPEDIQIILKEVVQRLNLDKVLPSHLFTVTVSCLGVIRSLQKNGYLPQDATIFKEYAVYGQFIAVRLAALRALVDMVQVGQSELELSFLLDIIENDPVPFVRIKVLQYLAENPPFTRKKESSLNSIQLVDRLWSTMSELFYDARLRTTYTDMYMSLYGRLTPPCLPQGLGIVIDLKEKVARTSLGSPVNSPLSDDIPFPGPSTSGLSIFSSSQSSKVNLTEISKSLPTDIFDTEKYDDSMPPPSKRHIGELFLSETPVGGEERSQKKKKKKDKSKEQKHKKKKKHKHKDI